MAQNVDVAGGFMLLINTTLSNQLKNLAATDPLTGLMNRRSLDIEIARQLANEQGMVNA